MLMELAESLPDGLVIMDRDWRIVYANREARRISRLRDEDLNGPTHWELYPDTIGSLIETAYHEVMFSRKPQTLPAFHYEPFDLWETIHIFPVDGGIALYYRDVTDAHKAEEARDAATREIDRQRQEAEAVYRGAPIGMALYDAKNLRLLRINDRQAEIFDVDAKRAVGMRFEDLVEGVPTGITYMRRAAEGERILNMSLEGALARRPEEHRHWTANYTPVFGEDGEVRAVATATIEVTHQKKSDLALMQSEKLAAVGRLAASIAHEINNPLESVTNLLFLAKSESNNPVVREYLEIADRELRRVSIIANQTLRFHKQPSAPRAVDSDDLYNTVVSLYEGRLRHSAIRVERRRRAERRVVCFEGDIRQVLHNLVSNAIDAMPTGGRLLLRSREATDWASGRDGSAPRKGLVLTVADTGCGIDAMTLKRIFEAFFTTKGMSGTGLGLWISAGIMERHQGSLRVRSSTSPTHHGTVFAVFLPFDAPLSH
ncbi:PAS domain S-box-containing protein [Bryocella elongata]|uniref:histidine kinase n=2 Tax=Bryocella elongata TaxID=863522 RepID=A0A1H6BWY8_9BACT|nr:PAS domain S-box-containing protein [Bryocella elongata]